MIRPLPESVACIIEKPSWAILRPQWELSPMCGLHAGNRGTLCRSLIAKQVRSESSGP